MEATSLTNEHTLKLLLRQVAQAKQRAEKMWCIVVDSCRLRHKRYHRVDTELHEDIELDDITALPALIAAADSVDLTETIDYLFSSFLADNCE